MPVLYTSGLKENKRQVALIPAPFVDISKDYTKTGDGRHVGATYNITLNGTILPDRGSPSSDGSFYGQHGASGDSESTSTVEDGKPSVSSKYNGEDVPSTRVQDSLMQKTQAIRELFSVEGRKLEIISWTQDEDGNSKRYGYTFYPRITGISINEDSYRGIVQYTVQLEADELYTNFGAETSPRIESPAAASDDSSVTNIYGEEDYNNSLIKRTLEEGQSFTDAFALETAKGKKIYLQDISEDWSIDQTGEYSSWGEMGIDDDDNDFPEGANKQDEFPNYNVSHSINATGKRTYDEDGLVREPWEHAKMWVHERLGVLPGETAATDDPKDFTPPEKLFDDDNVNKKGGVAYDVGGIMSTAYAEGLSDTTGSTPADFSDYKICNYTRSLQINKFGGTYAITESYTLTKSDFGAMESIEISEQGDKQGGIKNVTISGNITGQELRGDTTGKGKAKDMDIVSRTKYNSANEAYDKYKSDSFLMQIIDAYGISGDAGVLIRQAHSSSINRNEKDGTISFSKSFNDRPQNVAGSYSENIQVSTTRKVDAVATIPVPGRSEGPVIQDVGTKSVGQKTITVTAGMGRNGTKPNVTTIITAYAPSAADGLEVCKWISASQENWEPVTGNYTRTITYSFV